MGVMNKVSSDLVASGEKSRAEYQIVIDDLDKRVEIFVNSVIREQIMKQHKGHAGYVAMLAKYLTWVLMAMSRDDLVEQLAEAILTEVFLHPDVDGLDIILREMTLYQNYILKLLEKGHVPPSPFKFSNEKRRDLIYFDETESTRKMGTRRGFQGPHFS